MTITNPVLLLNSPQRTAPFRVVLSDRETLDAHGIDLPLDQARIVYCVLSHLLGGNRSKTRVELHAAIAGLVWMMRTPVERFGEHWPAPYPDLPLTGWPAGPTSFRKLGITYQQLEAAWRDARNRADDAVLPLDWVLAFLPARIWPAVWTLITWGPEKTGIRMEAAILDMARQPTQRPHRRRAAGARLSRGTIRNRATEVWRLIAAIIALRSHIHSAAHPTLNPKLLEAWIAAPPRPDHRRDEIPESDQNNHGPSIENTARRLRELARDAKPRPKTSRYLRLRRLVLFAIHVLHGQRADATRNLRVCDYLPAFQWNDGTTSPALRYYPGKTWERSTPHHLPVPNELAQWIEDWLALNGHTPGDSRAPFFPGRRARSGQPPNALTQVGHYHAVAGTPRRIALMPRGDDPHDGWHPHAFRHLAVKLAVRAAANCKGTDDRFAHVHNDEFARAVVGHKLVHDVTGAYRDLDRQELCLAVIPEMWQILYGDGALRRGPDPDRVCNAREHRDALQTTIDALRSDCQRKEAEAEDLTKRAAQTRDQNRKIRLLLEAANLSNLARVHRDDIDRFTSDLAAANSELDQAIHTLVPIPDELTDTDHARLLQDALGAPIEEAPSGPPAPQANELTVADIAELFDTTPQAINRWIRQGPPTNRPAPWDANAWRVITQKDKRLPVAHLNRDHLTQDQLHRLHYLQERRAQLDHQPPGDTRAVSP